MENNAGTVVTSDENKTLDEKEIKHSIELLKEKSSDHIKILEQLKELLNDSFDEEVYLGETLLQLGFLESAGYIFENSKDFDEHVVSYVIHIIKKINVKYYYVNVNSLLTPLDASDTLYSLMMKYSGSSIGEEARRMIYFISKNDSSEIIKSKELINSVFVLYPSKIKNSYEKKRNIFILFKDMLKEGMIKIENKKIKKEYEEEDKSLSDVIEKMMIIGEEIKKEKDILNVTEDMDDIINDFINMAKEKGFNEENVENKDEMILQFAFNEWEELCDEEQDFDSREGQESVIKEEEIEKIKKFCDRIMSESTNFRLAFIEKLDNLINLTSQYRNDISSFTRRKNGIFLKFFIPLYLKDYEYDDTFLSFLCHVGYYCSNKGPYYYYLKKDFIDEMMKKIKKELEEEEIEMNDSTLAIFIFLCYCLRIRECKENEVEILTQYFLKILNYFGKVEEVKEVKEKEKDIKLILNECKETKDMKRIMNRREFLMERFTRIIFHSYIYDYKSELIKENKDKRICNGILNLMKNHLKIVKELVQKGNKKRIIEYLSYSYDKNKEISLSFEDSSHFLPFSFKTLKKILQNFSFVFEGDSDEIKNEVLNINLEIVDCSIEVVKLVEEVIVFIISENLITKFIRITNILHSLICLMDWKTVFEEISSILIFNYFLRNMKMINLVRKMINFLCSHIHNNSNDDEEIIEYNADCRFFHYYPLNKRRSYFFGRLARDVISYYGFVIFAFISLAGKSEEDYGILNIYPKELSGEIIERVKRRERKNIVEERRRYERERQNSCFFGIVKSLCNLFTFVFKDKNVHLGVEEGLSNYEGKEKEIEEAKEYIMNILEEEDMRECLILFLKCKYESDNSNDEDSLTNNEDLSDIDSYSNDALTYLFCSFKKRKYREYEKMYEQRRFDEFCLSPPDSPFLYE